MNGRSVFVFIAVGFIMTSVEVQGHDVSGAKPVLFVPESAASGPGPRRCCFPPQLSVKMTTLNTINSDKINVQAMQLDYGTQQQAMLNYTGSEEPENKVVIDYKKGILYSVPTKYPTSCYKVPFNMPLVRCIPDEAEYLGSSYLGPLGDAQLPYDAWRFTLKEFLITMVVTKEGCVPVLEGVSYPSGGQQYFFSGFQPKLTDPLAFKLPKSCF